MIRRDARHQTVRTDSIDECVRRAMRSITSEARDCLLLRTLDKLDYPDIARRVGVSEQVAIDHVHRTRRFLRHRFAEMLAKTNNSNEFP